MPNYCENDLYIQGKEADVKRVLDLIGPGFDFGKVIPYPKMFAQMDRDHPGHGAQPNRNLDCLTIEAYREKYGHDKDGFNSGGYEWKCKHWGCKWNAADVKRRDYGPICITFQTAWSPPVPIIQSLGDKFPDVTFSLEYFERGMEFMGGLTIYCQEEAEERELPGRRVEWHSKGYKGMRGG